MHGMQEGAEQAMVNIQIKMRYGALVGGLLLLISQPMLYGWGENGHDLITQVAVRLSQDNSDITPQLRELWRRKSHMLGHLANIPDTHWRNLPSKDQQLGNPTHYIDGELLAENPWINPPQRFSVAISQVLQRQAINQTKFHITIGNPKDAQQLLGSLPWRIEQFSQEMESQFKRLTAAKTKKEKRLALFQMLKYAGLLSHFVGDASNPHHTTINFDGWRTGQGGLHQYFESDIVDQFGLSLPAAVLAFAQQNRPFHQLVKQSNLQKKQKNNTYIALAYILIANSNNRLAQLEKLDRGWSLLKPSIQAGNKKIVAQRKAPEQAKEAFKAFIIERLAMGADALAFIWAKTYREANAPKINSTVSHGYHLQPPFIPPNY